MTIPVDDALVQAKIDKTLRELPAVAGDSVIFRVSRAFVALRDERRTPANAMDLVLAAAEHYMFARQLCGNTGDPVARFAPFLYGLKKRLYFFFGQEERMATTALPVTPPNASVERWGERGAEDGLKDYTQSAGRAPSNYGSAVGILMKEAGRHNYGQGR